MPSFAPVAPIEVARVLKANECLGKYHLLLAHDVNARPDDYREIYSDLDTLTAGSIIPLSDTLDAYPYDVGITIMDNSVIELGEPVSAADMFRAVTTVPASVVVLPDHLLNKDLTIKETLRGIDTYHEAIAVCGGAMAVPQGINFSDWISCLEKFADVPEISWIGIPRNLNEKLGISRMRAIDAVMAICGTSKDCHLLGFSDNLWDDIQSMRYGASMGICHGIDSAAPLWSGWRDGYEITLSRAIPNKRRDWFTNPQPSGSTVFEARMMQNVAQVRRWIGDSDVVL